MAHGDVMIEAMQEFVRRAISEAASEEIEKQRQIFEQELDKVQRAAIGKLVERMQISVEQDALRGRYIIQINIHPDGNRKGGDG